MAQTVCVLSDGRYFPLSDRVSTSFYRERKEVVLSVKARHPRDYGSYLHCISTVPNWNTPSTISTLKSKLEDPRAYTIVAHLKGSDETVTLNYSEVADFRLV